MNILFSNDEKINFVSLLIPHRNENNVNLLFYLKKPKNYQSGVMPIYIRFTVDGKRSEAATSLSIAIPSFISIDKTDVVLLTRIYRRLLLLPKSRSLRNGKK